MTDHLPRDGAASLVPGTHRGGGTSTGLNPGDCFSSALARACSAPLLFKGDDLTQANVSSVL